MNATALSLKMKDDLHFCKKHLKNMMPEVASILEENNIDFTINKKQTEIKVCGKQKNIKKLLRENVSIPNMQFGLLINIHEINDKTYIRLKRK